MGTGECSAGGNPAMDWHPFQGGVEILLVASIHATETGVKRRPDRPLGPNADLTFFTLFKVALNSFQPLYFDGSL